MTNARVVHDRIRYGIYVLEMPDGSMVGDNDGNILNIPSEFGDLIKIGKLMDAARYYGLDELGVQPKFLPGHRRITDSEYEQQLERMSEGLTPDPYDLFAAQDEIEGKRNGY